jgi:hypothetical protein
MLRIWNRNIQDTPVRVEQMPMHPTISENNYAGEAAPGAPAPAG